MNRHLVSLGSIVACTLLAISCGSHPSAGDATEGIVPAPSSARPGSVPEGYVATASGYQHASCVIALSLGDEIIDQGASGLAVRRADGSVRHFDPCPYPTLKSTGEIVATVDVADAPEAATSDPTSAHLLSTYPAFGQVSPAAAPLKGLRSTMIVPGVHNDEERNEMMQFDLWPGLQAVSPSTWVLQPVLQLWGANWQMVPVYNHSGMQMMGTGVDTFPGDIVSGTVTGTNCDSSTHICSTWTVQLTDLTTGQSTEPWVVNSFTAVAQRVIFGAVELHAEQPVPSCLSLPGFPLPNFATEWQGFNGVWSNTKPTIVKNTESLDCLYDAWVAPKGGLSSLYVGWWAGNGEPYGQAFDTDDWREYTGLGDWAPGQFKSECGAQDWVVGVSANPSTGRAHSAACAYDGNVNSKLLNPAWSVAVDFSNTSRQRDTGTGDWDPLFFKGECASNEAVTGIAQSTDGKLTKVLCTRMYQEARSGACYTRIFQTSDNRGNTTGDWAYGWDPLESTCRHASLSIL